MATTTPHLRPAPSGPRIGLATRGYALATDNLDVDLDGAGWILRHSGLDHVRIQVEPRTSEPVFAGVARTPDVSAYLAGTPHTVVRDVSYSPFHATYADRAGALRPAPPARQAFWAAAVHGSGTQTLEWDVRDGDWSVVVMNADASRSVAVRVGVGVQAGALAVAAWIAVGGGAALLALAGLLLVRARAKAGAL